MYSQTMAARFDCKKLLRFALATLCLLALALLMPVAARAEETDKSKETTKWEAKNENGDTLYATFERNGTAGETVLKQGEVNLEVYVMKPGKAAYSEGVSQVGTDYDKYTTTFKYQYNANEDNGLTFHAESHTFDQLPITNEDQKGTGKGGYGSLDLKVTAGAGYTIYRVDYSVCYSSGGPTKTGWKTQEFKEKENVEGPTSYCYLDNIQDDTTARVYLMPAYKVQYKVVDKDGNSADESTYSVAPDDSLADVIGVLPYKENLDNIKGCDVLGETTSYEYGKGSIAPYHRWCNAANEEDAVKRVKKQLEYNANTSVTLPKLKAAENYTVSAWKHNGKEYSGTLDLSTLSAADFEALANDKENPLTITLTAVVTDNKPENTDNSGNGGNNSGDNNNNGGDSGNNGGQESTPTPTPAPTASVTTVTAVAPTATPTATPAPTAEPTATPAPAAVSAHIPQTSDDMPYTLLVVTALASLCAAGALFMKRRSK
mgnify:CR=1 FL=1